MLWSCHWFRENMKMESKPGEHLPDLAPNWEWDLINQMTNHSGDRRPNCWSILESVLFDNHWKAANTVIHRHSTQIKGRNTPPDMLMLCWLFADFAWLWSTWWAVCRSPVLVLSSIHRHSKDQFSISKLNATYLSWVTDTFNAYFHSIMRLSCIFSVRSKNGVGNAASDFATSILRLAPRYENNIGKKSKICEKNVYVKKWQQTSHRICADQ